MKRNSKSTMLTARSRAAGDSEKETLITLDATNGNDKNSATYQGKKEEEHDESDSKLFRRQLTAHQNFPLILEWLKLRYHWTLMSPFSKIASALIATILLQHLVFGTYDRFFHRVGGNLIQHPKKEPLETSFAVAINTYKRPDRLKSAVQHYADTCGKRAGVSQVFVIWAEQGVEVPEPSSFFTSKTRTTKSMLGNRAEVHVLQKEKNSLNSRFEPIEQVKSKAVFMVDDDIRVACPSLVHAFNAWNENPDTMVGYYPRLASPPRSSPKSPSDLIYHTWPVVFVQHKFNFVLTKASFLHSKYLSLYTGDDFPQAIRDHVDQHMNCEDIAMSMLVANYTKYEKGKPSSPIYVEGSVSDVGLFGGISTGSGHMTTRSDCLSKLTSIFLEKGWESPLSYELSLSEFSWIKHAPGFWWQSRPSNFFEWLSFANTFL